MSRCGESRFTQDFTGAVDEVKLIVGSHINTCSVSLQAAIEEGVELTGVAEDNLTRKGDVFGEEDLLHGRAKFCSSLYG